MSWPVDQITVLRVNNDSNTHHHTRGFGEGLIHAGSLILGEIPHCMATGLFPGMSFDAFIEQVASEIERNSTEDGTLVLVDLFGGTPGNASVLAKRLIKEDLKYAVVSGANLPMLLEAHCNRDGMTLEELRDHVLEVCATSGKDVLKALGI